jgi:glycosyltransferase involved in cell wall biosynthesis
MFGPVIETQIKFEHSMSLAVPSHPLPSPVSSGACAAVTVSVVIPAFNCGDEIVGAINSALAQVGVVTEVLVVNDGSTDGRTVEVLRQLQLHHPEQLTVLHQPNQGPAAARNNAIREAKGDWVAFLDHDDRWSIDKLQQQLKIAIDHAVDIVLTAAENFDDIRRVAQLRAVPAIDTQTDVYRELLADNFVTLSSVLVRRDCLLMAGLFDEQWKGVEDWALWLTLANIGCRFSSIPDPLVQYRWHATSLSRNHDAMQRQRRELIRQSLKSARGRQLNRRDRRKILADERLCSAWFMAEASPRKAILLYLQALRHRPLDVPAWKGVIKGLLRRS